ncbi:MAG: uroporphyrinogen-III synthase [Pseudomonadota bacterium]
MATRRVIVTRPAQESARWVDALRAAGLEAVPLPLIRINAMSDTAALQQARDHLRDYGALMFVSAAAVVHFFDGVVAVPASVRCWATGPGTARALRQAGVGAGAIDMPSEDAAQFDSEALWALVRPQVLTGTRVLVVRGGDAEGRPSGRDWLAREIAAAGGRVDTVVAYRRLPPSFDENDERLATEGAAGQWLWLFSSSEAIGNLRRAAPDLHWQGAIAVATHPRIAEAARDAGFGVVHVCPPALPALVASIESLQ